MSVFKRHVRNLSFLFFLASLFAFQLVLSHAALACSCVCVSGNSSQITDSPTSRTDCNDFCQYPPINSTVNPTASTCDDVIPPGGGTTPGGGSGTDQAEIYEKQGVWFPKDPLDISGNIKDKPKTILKNTILLVLKFAGAGAFLLSLYAGFIIMFARGEAKKVAEGKKIIVYAVVGLVVILMSYLMLNLIFSVLQKAVT